MLREKICTKKISETPLAARSKVNLDVTAKECEYIFMLPQQNGE
jgi:hypothetical protein